MSEGEILETLRTIYTHGVRLPPCPARDRLRKAGLIIGRQGKTGHSKTWMLTEAGRKHLGNELGSAK